jgi:alpha-1,6-mannosyltransferase
MRAVADDDETGIARARASQRWARRATVGLGALGTLGMVLLGVSSAVIGPTGPTDSTVERAILSIVPKGTAGTAVGAITMTLGLALAIGAWLAIGLLLRRGEPVARLQNLALAWAIPLMLAPPMFSRDLYSYAADGRMVQLHISPYEFGPAALGASRFLAPVSQTWLSTPSPYGPLFLRLAAVAERLSGGSIVNTIMILRLLEVAGVVMIAVSLPKLARAAGHDPARAVWLGVCNPLVLVHFIGGGHNDALMIGLIVAGLAVATCAHRPLLGILLCMVAATIKVPAVIPAGFIALDAVRRVPAERRVPELARLGGIGAVAFGALSWMCGLGWGWIGALGIPGTNRLLLTPTTFVAHWISVVVGHEAGVLTLVRGAGTLGMLGGIGYLLWRSPKLGTVRASGLALVLIVALGPIVLPWYALWGLIVLAAAGNRVERGYAVFASVVLSIVVQPSGSSMPDVVLMAAVVVLAAPLVAIAWQPARTWARDVLPAAIDEYRSRGRVGLRPALRVGAGDLGSRGGPAGPSAR